MEPKYEAGTIILIKSEKGSSQYWKITGVPIKNHWNYLSYPVKTEKNSKKLMDIV